MPHWWPIAMADWRDAWLSVKGIVWCDKSPNPTGAISIVVIEMIEMAVFWQMITHLQRSHGGLWSVIHWMNKFRFVESNQLSHCKNWSDADGHWSPSRCRYSSPTSLLGRWLTPSFGPSKICHDPTVAGRPKKWAQWTSVRTNLWADAWLMMI